MAVPVVSEKALKILGATEDEVRFEKAFVMMSSPERRAPGGQRFYIECALGEDDDIDEPGGETDSEPKKKVEKILGVNDEPPLNWLRRDPSQTGRKLRSKALATLGATIDDVRIEKALLVLGEAPGREVPAGPLPRPHPLPRPKSWSVPPPNCEPVEGLSVFLLAFFPWGVLAPLNILKLQLNKVSPGAHLWVPGETEECQAACGVARM